MMLEGPEDEVEEVKLIMKECMEDATELKVPLVAEISVARSWYECK